MKIRLLTSLVAAAMIAPPAEAEVKTEGLGLSSFGNWTTTLNSQGVNTTHCPELKTVQIIKRWKDLEPSNGQFMFASQMGQQITDANAMGAFVKILIYAGPDAPSWVFSVCGTITTDFNGGAPAYLANYPDYTNPAYQTHFFDMIDQFGAYLNTLSPDLRSKVLFVIAAEGATADGWAYKGSITNPNAVVNLAALTKKPDGEPSDWWNTFRQNTWVRYKAALPAGIPILVNSDSNTTAMDNWLIANMPVVAIKVGMFSHGYHVNDAIDRLAKFRSFEALVYAAGKELITEGELDGEVYRSTTVNGVTTYLGWGRENLPQAVYWSALFALHNPVHSWNVISEVLTDPNYASVYGADLDFFNAYAVRQRPETSERAFIALVDGLNAADTVRFPVATYGTATLGNTQRYNTIKNAFASRGARLEDAAAATSSSLGSRKPENGYNDVGWKIIPSNYSRFITQVDPGTEDVGWWHVDQMKTGCTDAAASPEGRFARGFDTAFGKNAMYFNVDDNLGTTLFTSPNQLCVQVSYFDEVPNSTWKLVFHNGAILDERPVTCTGSLTWKKVEFEIPAVLQNRLHGNTADLALINTDDNNDIFHRIEVVITGTPGNNVPGSWQSADIGAVAAAGSANFASVYPAGHDDPTWTWTVKGSGADIWGGADEFRYVHRSANGDCTVIARVASIQNTHQWAKAGLMIRESTAPGAPNAFVCVTPSNGVNLQVRTVTGGTTAKQTAASFTAPKWLKLTRTGNSFAGYYSDNGFTWTQVGTAQTIAMATDTTIGLAVTSHNDGVLGTSSIESVSVVP